jgi:pre-mRNA cleavage complex 2 protein Pcf11
VKAEFAQDPLDTSKQTRLKALLDLQSIIQSQEMPQDQLMIVRDQIAEIAVNMRSQPQPRPAVTAAPGVAAATAPHPAHAGIPYTTTPTPPVVSQQPTPVPPAALAAVAAALGRPPPAAAAPPPAAGGGGVSIDSLFGKGALATLIAGAARKSATPQQIPTPTPPPAVPQPAPAVVPLRSPPPQRPVEPAQPAVVPSTNPSALLAMLRQSGLIGPSATEPSASAVPGLSPAVRFPPAGTAHLPDTSLQLKPSSLKM